MEVQHATINIHMPLRTLPASTTCCFSSTSPLEVVVAVLLAPSVCVSVFVLSVVVCNPLLVLALSFAPLVVGAAVVVVVVVGVVVVVVVVGAAEVVVVGAAVVVVVGAAVVVVHFGFVGQSW